MRPGNSYRGAKNRDTLGGKYRIGATGKMTALDGVTEIDIRREQSLFGVFARKIEKPPGKTVREFGANVGVKTLRAYSRSQMEAMRKTPSRRPMMAGIPNA
jgi:hypothetical protein